MFHNAVHNIFPLAPGSRISWYFPKRSSAKKRSWGSCSCLQGQPLADSSHKHGVYLRRLMATANKRNKYIITAIPPFQGCRFKTMVNQLSCGTTTKQFPHGKHPLLGSEGGHEKGIVFVCCCCCLPTSTLWADPEVCIAQFQYSLLLQVQKGCKHCQNRYVNNFGQPKTVSEMLRSSQWGLPNLIYILAKISNNETRSSAHSIKSIWDIKMTGTDSKCKSFCVTCG